MEEFISLSEAINQHNFEKIVELCEQNPQRMNHPELLPALHLLAKDARDSNFFKQAWSYFISKGCDPYEKPYKKQMNPLEILILKNPAFYDHKEFSNNPMEEAFWWVYHNFYNDPKYLPPDDQENHIIHFAYKYSSVLPSYYEEIKEPAVALFNYTPKSNWFDYVPSAKIYQIYKDMFALEDISEITFTLTGSRAPSFKKFVEENFKNYNFELLGFIRNICALDLKHEEKMELLNYYAVHGPNHAFTQYVPRVSPYAAILPLMSFRRFFRIFIENSYMNKDTLEMLARLQAYNIPVDFRDFNTGRELHDYCSRELNRHEHALFLQRQTQYQKSLEFNSEDFFNQLNIVRPLNGKKSEEYELYIPQEITDVYHWGRTLNICIGSSHYISKVASGELKIIFIKKQGKEFGCCTIDSERFGILEIKGPCNSLIDMEARMFLVKECIALKNELEKIRPQDRDLKD